MASGVTISNCYRRHVIDANLPPGFEVHLFVDNYGTHKISKAQRWLAVSPCYHVHFTLTGGSWLNLVERLFAEVTDCRGGIR